MLRCKESISIDSFLLGKLSGGVKKIGVMILDSTANLAVLFGKLIDGHCHGPLRCADPTARRCSLNLLVGARKCLAGGFG